MFTHSLSLSLATFLFIQTPTIPESIVANNGKPVSFDARGDSRGIPLDELISSAVLIARGKLVRIESHLSGDKRHIWTTYQLIPARVLLDRTIQPTAPGTSEPLTVTLYGGTVSLLGTTATVVDKSVKPWTDGAELVVFLTKATDIGAKGYRPVGGASGMFEISSDQMLVSLRSHAPDRQEIDGIPFDSIVSAVASAAKGGDR